MRKNTLMVLTHLILNDMVKVKGQISEMATCLEDKDSRISDLAKLFFLELSKKVKQSVSQFRAQSYRRQQVVCRIQSHSTE